MPYTPVEPDIPVHFIENWLNDLVSTPYEQEFHQYLAHDNVPTTSCQYQSHITMTTPESPRKRMRASMQEEWSRDDVMESPWQATGSERDEEDQVEEETPRSSRQTLAYHSSRRPPSYRAHGIPTLSSASGSPQPRRARDASSHMPSLSPARSESSTATSKTTTTTSTNPRRQRSPVKSITDLYLAAKPFEYNNEAVLPPALEALRDIRDHMNIIPCIIKDDVQKALDSNEVLRPWMVDHTDALGRDEALRELYEIQLIHSESKYCQREGASEAAWNDGVTSRILFLALRSTSGVRHHNITTARPENCLVPKDLSGEQFDGKLVDYSMNLVTRPEDCKPNQGSTAGEPRLDDGLEGAIRNLLSHVPSKRKTINQTCYGPVRFNPAGVSIETKAGSSLDGRVQLSVWIAAWMEQMRYLRAVAHSQRSEPPETTKTPQDAIELPMPLIVVSGSLWKLHLATDMTDKIIISSLFMIGDTSSLLGIYCLVKSLRLLAAWTDGPFRKFIRDEILAMSPSG